MIQHFHQVVRFRALVSALAGRQIASRYRGSALGFVWSVLNPILFMAVYTVVFHYYVRVTNLEHYAVFVFCGLLPWTWLTAALGEGTASIAGSGHLITKSLFPPQVLPLASVLSTGANFILAIPVFVVIALASGHPIPWTIVFLPVLFVLQLLFLYGVVLVLSAANVFFRDVQHLVAHVLMVLFFLCPILYTAETVPEAVRWTLALNPCASLVSGYQSVLFYGQVPAAEYWVFQGAVTLLAVFIGIRFFEGVKERFAELL